MWPQSVRGSDPEPEPPPSRGQLFLLVSFPLRLPPPKKKETRNRGRRSGSVNLPEFPVTSRTLSVPPSCRRSKNNPITQRANLANGPWLTSRPVALGILTVLLLPAPLHRLFIASSSSPSRPMTAGRPPMAFSSRFSFWEQKGSLAWRSSVANTRVTPPPTASRADANPLAPSTVLHAVWC